MSTLSRVGLAGDVLSPVERFRRSSSSRCAGFAGLAAGAFIAVYWLGVGTRAGRSVDRFVYTHSAQGVLELVGDLLVSAVNPVTAILAVVFLVWAAYRAGRPNDGIRAAIIVAAAVAGSGLLKPLLGDVDPFGGEGARAIDPSFYPSGHAAATMAICLVTLLVFQRPRRKLVLAACTFSSAVGFVTFAGRDHHLSDVLGGFLLAAAVAALGLMGRSSHAGNGHATRLPAAGIAAVICAVAAGVMLLEATRLLFESPTGPAGACRVAARRRRGLSALIRDRGRLRVAARRSVTSWQRSTVRLDLVGDR